MRRRWVWIVVAVAVALAFLLIIAVVVSNSRIGCDVNVYGQNQFETVPGNGVYGASVREYPGADSAKYPRGVLPNEAVMIDGWAWADKLAYPNNPAGIQGKVWYRLKGGGWVVDAGVRAEKTQTVWGNLDSGLQYVVEMPPKCELP